MPPFQHIFYTHVSLHEYQDASRIINIPPFTASCLFLHGPIALNTQSIVTKLKLERQNSRDPCSDLRKSVFIIAVWSLGIC